MTDWDEEEERKRSVKFVDNVIPDTRAQLRVLSKSYQVSYDRVVQSSIKLIQDYRVCNFSVMFSVDYLSFRFEFI